MATRKERDLDRDALLKKAVEEISLLKEVIEKLAEDIKAEKGAYFVCSQLTLEPNSEKTWMLVANVNQTMVNISEITELIKKGTDLNEIVQKDIELGSKKLLELNAASDGLQLTADKLMNTRHFSNTVLIRMFQGLSRLRMTWVIRSGSLAGNLSWA